MIVTVAAVRSQATTVRGELGGKAVDVMLDSGSSVLLVECNTLTGMKDVVMSSVPNHCGLSQPWGTSCLFLST